MTDTTVIYVSLPDEGVEVWRPVFAERVGDLAYRIAVQPYDATVERWEYEPGDLVRCERRTFVEGGVSVELLVATARAAG